MPTRVPSWGVCASRNEASCRQEVLGGGLCAVSGNPAAAGCRESVAGAPCSWRAYAVIKLLSRHVKDSKRF